MVFIRSVRYSAMCSAFQLSMRIVSVSPLSFDKMMRGGAPFLYLIISFPNESACFSMKSRTFG